MTAASSNKVEHLIDQATLNEARYMYNECARICEYLGNYPLAAEYERKTLEQPVRNIPEYYRTAETSSAIVTILRTTHYLANSKKE